MDSLLIYSGKYDMSDEKWLAPLLGKIHTGRAPADDLYLNPYGEEAWENMKISITVQEKK